MILLGLVQNMAVLIALAAIYQVTAGHLRRVHAGHQVVAGLLFGAGGVVAMLTPLRFMPGIIFDGRSIILSVAGLFGGPVVATVAALICAGYRLWLGGAGAWVGIGSIALSAIMGVAFHYLRRRRIVRMRPLVLWLFGLLVHLGMMLLMHLLPGEASREVLARITLPVLTLYPMATLLVCLFFLGHERQRMDRETLHESEARYHSLFSTNMDAVLLTTPDGGTLAANEAACRMLGYTEEELKHIGRRGVMDQADPRLAASIDERRRTGRFHGELTMIRKDGSKFPVELSSAIFLDSRGEEQSSVVIRDITERNKAEQALRESEAYVKAVLDNLPVGVAVNSVDPAVKFNYMNDNFPRFYRVTREVLSDPDAFWSSVYEDPVFREEIRRRVLADCASGDASRMYWRDIPIQRQGGETTYITARNIPLPDRALMVSTVWDVTDHKRAEEQLQRQLAELRRWQEVTVGREERVAELKREVNELAQRLGEKPRYGGE